MTLLREKIKADEATRDREVSAAADAWVIARGISVSLQNHSIKSEHELAMIIKRHLLAMSAYN